MKTNYEVIIVGSGYGALICGAILARNGVKPLVVEELDILGGTQAAVEIPKHRGYFSQLGHRDSHDTGDFLNFMASGHTYGLEASDRAGANVKQVQIHPGLRAHVLPEGIVTVVDPDPSDLSSLAMYLQLSDEQMQAFLETLGSIAMSDSQELMSVPLGEWLSANVKEKEVRDAFLHFAITMYCHPPEIMSVGRLGQIARAFFQGWHPNDPEFPGMSGLIEPYARVIRENGGEIRMGLKTTEIVVEESKITGIVVQDVSGYVEMLEASVVVCNLNIWDALDIMGPDLFPEELVKNAGELKRYGGDVLTYNAGLSRMPTIRKENVVDAFPGWNRIQGGPDWDYMGGWYFPSLTSPNIAPKGKHLISAAYGNSNRGAFKSFKEAKGKVDRIVDYLRRFYLDLDEVTEWSGYVLHQNPTIATWLFLGIPLPPMKPPTVEGLYFVGQTVDVPGGMLGLHDVGAKSGMDVADMILEGRE